MMYNYPFFSFPWIRRYNAASAMYYNRSPVSTFQLKQNPYDFSKGYTNSKLHTDKENCKNSNNKTSNNKTNNSKSSYGFNFWDNFFHQADRDENESYFDLFGLKLYDDDLLLIGMIFFLYKEDVKDQYLFIALILLLLS